jgi:hypothetical protein
MHTKQAAYRTYVIGVRVPLDSIPTARAGVRGRKGIPGQMAGGAYSRNKSTSVRLGDHFERTQQKDDR